MSLLSLDGQAEESKGEGAMTPMSLAWAVLKSPLRGTQGAYFDQSQQEGAFAPRFGVTGNQGTIHGVWAAGADDPMTPITYAMKRGDLGPGQQPMVHTMPQQGAVMQAPGQGYTGALRYDRSDFPEGVPTQGVQTVWRGPSFETYMQHPSVNPNEKNWSDYYARMGRDYARSVAQFFHNQGTLPYETHPEHIIYPNQDPAEDWRRLARNVPGEAGKWMRERTREDRPFYDEAERYNFERERDSNREAILAPTLTGNEVPYYKRERSNIPSLFSMGNTSKNPHERDAYVQTWGDVPWENMVFPDQTSVRQTTSLFGRPMQEYPKNTGWVDSFDIFDEPDPPMNTGWVNPETGRMVGVV